MQLLSSIHNKLLLAFIVVTLPPLVALGWYGGSTIEDSLRRGGLQRLEARIDGVSALFQGLLSGIEGDLLLLADNPAVSQYLLAADSGDRALVAAAKKNLAQTFSRLLEVRSVYYQILFLDASGTEKLRARNAGDGIAVVEDGVRDLSPSHPLFRQGGEQQRGVVRVSPIELNRIEGEVETPHRPVIHFSTLVFDTASRRRGTLAITVSAGPTLERVSAAATDGDALFMVDSDGFFLSHADAAKRWGGPNDLASGTNLRTQYPRHASKILGIRTPFTHEGYESFTIGRPIAAPVSNAPILGVVVDIMPTENLYAQASRFRNFLNLLMGASLLVAITIGVIVARVLTQPIKTLTEAVDRMSRGELDRPIEVKSNDETHTLAVAMERLRKSMRLILEKLEQ